MKIMEFFPDEEMDGPQFEEFCLEMIKHKFPNDSYKVEPKHRLSSKRTGQTMIIDIYVAERRPGGSRYVIECKSYRKSKLKKHGVQKTKDYKRGIRGKAAAMLVRVPTRENNNFRPYAEEQGISVIEVHTKTSNLLTKILNFPAERKLKRIIERGSQ